MFEQLKMGKQSVDNETGEQVSAMDSEQSKYQISPKLTQKAKFMTYFNSIGGM